MKTDYTQEELRTMLYNLLQGEWKETVPKLTGQPYEKYDRLKVYESFPRFINRRMYSTEDQSRHAIFNLSDQDILILRDFFVKDCKKTD